MTRAPRSILLLAALIAGGGCRQGALRAATGDVVDGDARAVAPPVGSHAAAEPPASDIDEKTPAVREEPSSVPERFEWTETPMLEAIPATPPTGEVHGAPFPVARVVFETGRHGWQMYFLEKALPDPTAPIEGMRFLRVDLPEEPAAGAVQQHPLGYGGALFYVDVPGDPGSFTLWTADNAWILELTEWDVQPWDPAGPEVQVAGRAAGRVAVCYRGGGNYRNAWVAGTFAGAVVRYTREPRFERGCPTAPGGG